MNLTYAGIHINDEDNIFDTDKKVIAETRLEALRYRNQNE